jgi:uncharacterized protein YdcH (DUF465 family)
MPLSQEELKASLIATSEEFRRLVAEHAEYKKQLEALSSRPYLTPQEQLEETRIKKLKLRLKDQMQEMMDRHRAQQPA